MNKLNMKSLNVGDIVHIQTECNKNRNYMPNTLIDFIGICVEQVHSNYVIYDIRGVQRTINVQTQNYLYEYVNIPLSLKNALQVLLQRYFDYVNVRGDMQSTVQPIAYNILQMTQDVLSNRFYKYLMNTFAKKKDVIQVLRTCIAQAPLQQQQFNGDDAHVHLQIDFIQTTDALKIQLNVHSVVDIIQNTNKLEYAKYIMHDYTGAYFSKNKIDMEYKQKLAYCDKATIQYLMQQIESLQLFDNINTDTYLCCDSDATVVLYVKNIILTIT